MLSILLQIFDIIRWLTLSAFLDQLGRYKLYKLAKCQYLLVRDEQESLLISLLLAQQKRSRLNFILLVKNLDLKLHL